MYGKLAATRAERGGAHAVRLVPLADREQRLDAVGDEHGAVDPVPAQRPRARLPQPRRLSRPAQHRQRVGEVDVRPLQAQRIADLLGEPQGLAQMDQTLLGAAEIGQVAAEHGERPDLRLAARRRARASASACSAIGSDSAWRQATINPPASDPSAYARSARRRVGRHDLDRPLERGQSASSLPISCRYSPRRTCSSAARYGSSVADELDRTPGELDRARGGADLAGELGRPGAELGEVDPGELGRVRHGVPQRERPLEVGQRLGQTEDGLGLSAASTEATSASLRDRRPPSGVRAPPAPRLRCARAPRRAGRAAPRARRAGSSRRPPRPAARGGSGRCPLACSATRTPCSTAWRSDSRTSRSGSCAVAAQQRVPDVAAGGRGQAQQALRRTVEPGHAPQQEVAQAGRQLAVSGRRRRRGAPRRRTGCPPSGR